MELRDFRHPSTRRLPPQMILLLASMLTWIHGGTSMAADALLRSNWPGFRGPQGNGHSTEIDLPVRWGPEENLSWKTRLPGVGASSPVVWEDQIFFSASLEKGYKRAVLCINRGDGSVRWQRVMETGDPGATRVGLNDHASSTCVTDGEHVYSFFGKGGLYCHSLEGQLVWQRQMEGEFFSIWGSAASPILHGEKLIINCDQDSVLASRPPKDLPSKAYLIALGKRSGRTIWKRPRAASRGWGTPVVICAPDGEEEIVLNGPDGVRAYEPETGRERWVYRRDVNFGTPCVVAGHGLIFAIAGRRGPMLAIRQGGKGEITNTMLAWSCQRKSRDIASPILWDDLLYTVDFRRGIAWCYEARTGELVWQHRMGNGYGASPVAADGRIYFLSRAGVTTVIQPDRVPNVIAVNQLASADGEDFLGSPAISNGQIFLRSTRALYCIGTAR